MKIVGTCVGVALAVAIVSGPALAVTNHSFSEGGTTGGGLYGWRSTVTSSSGSNVTNVQAFETCTVAGHGSTYYGSIVSALNATSSTGNHCVAGSVSNSGTIWN